MGENMSYLSDDDDDNNNNNQPGVNVQGGLVENPTDKPSTDKKTRDKIISSKINRFAKGFKIPNDKKRKKAKISRYK
jgi:Ni/Co efflux regulator RcnB